MIHHLLPSDLLQFQMEQKRLHLPGFVALLLSPNGTGAPRVHAVADRHGQSEELLGVRVLAVQLLSGVSVLNIHLDELHPRLVLVERWCVAVQATHAPTTQDEIKLVQLPLLQGENVDTAVHQDAASQK